MKRLCASLIVSATFACAACGESSVEAYCSYGAVSRAQLDGCTDHVTENDFDHLKTNAARYARGELDKCLADSGPFCEDR